MTTESTGEQGAPFHQVSGASGPLALAWQRLYSWPRLLGDEPELEVGRAADQFFGPLGILDAGQLHDDLARALLLNRRFRHAKLVDAVTDDLERLFDDAVPHARQLARL